jgi:hypothetical protein
MGGTAPSGVCFCECRAVWLQAWGQYVCACGCLRACALRVSASFKAPSWRLAVAVFDVECPVGRTAGDLVQSPGTAC